MDFEETPLLHFPGLVLALLRASGPATATLVDAARLIEHDRVQAHEDDTVSRQDLLDHLDEARCHLVAAQLIDMADDHHFRITPRGRALLHDHCDGIDDTVLTRFPEFRHWLDRTRGGMPPEDARGREFQRGWMAFDEGTDLGDNPFTTDTAQHGAWEDGWLEAERHRNEFRLR